MELNIFCEKCRCELKIKNVEIEDSNIAIDVERCSCEDENQYQIGFDDGQNFMANRGY